METEVNSSNERGPAEQLPAPKKRFRIEKLEERVAPAKGGNSKSNGSSFDGGGGSNSSGWTQSNSIF
jgi:hypothetical protein